MNRNSRRLSLAIAVAAIFAVAACVLRTLACLSALESNMIYYSDQRLITAANIVLIVGAVLASAIALTMDREPLRANFSTPLTFVPAGIAAIALLIFGLCMLAIYTVSDTPLPNVRTDTAAKLALASAILAPISAVHFLLSALLTERHTRLRAFFALGTVLIGAAYASYLYFNAGSPINAPNKITEQMAYLFASLFFLYETRISLGREMWRAYSAFGLIAATLSAYTSLPALIAYAAKGSYVTATVESAVLLAAFSFFIFTRLCMTASAAPDSECPEMAALRKFAERRAEELISGKIEDGTQISIAELIEIPKVAITDDDEDAQPEIEPEDEPDEKAPETTNDTESNIGAPEE